jgi:hypothetical protein
MKKIIGSLLLVTCFMITVLAGENVFAMDNDSYDSDKKLSIYSTIIINDFETKDITIKLLDEDEISKFKPLLSQMVKNITDGIVVRIKKETKFTEILTNTSEISKNAVRLEGKIEEFNGGHGAAKWALGFFAPKSVKTYLAYSGKLVDVQTGKVLGTFSDTNKGSLWFKDSVSYSKDMLDDISGSVSNFIKDNYN